MTRSEAVNWLINITADIGKAEHSELWHYEQALSEIREMLESEPERKKGKWIFIGNQMFECSECGTCYTQSQFHQMRVRISDPEFPKFCPYCGARMSE